MASASSLSVGGAKRDDGGGLSALKFESDDQMPSQGSESVEGTPFVKNYFAPIVTAPTPASVDSDIAVTDAGMTDDGSADIAAAPSAHKMERFSSPLSTASTAATPSAITNGKKVKVAAASASSRRRGGGAGRGGVRPKAKAPALLRGDSNSSIRGRSSGSVRMRGGKKTVASGETNGRRRAGLAAFAETYAPSPSPSIKREPGSDDDDGDNEQEDDDDDDDIDEDDDDEIRSSSARLAEPGGDDGDSDEGGGGDHDEGDGETSDNGPYCICRGPDDHRWMIQCDECEDWFHGDCVNINKEEGETIILSYLCPNCTIRGRYETRFRILCSLPSCRKPAHLYGEDGVSPLAPELTSNFCSDTHRDQWWDMLLGLLERSQATNVPSAGSRAAATAEAKIPVGQLTLAQIFAILTHTDQPCVIPMLLHGLAQDDKVDIDSLLLGEERTNLQTSAADRYRLAEQVVMCKKMLQLLDMARTRSQEAIRQGHTERDCCGYDERLQHVAVQPHFGLFLASLEGMAIFRSDTLVAPRFDEDGNATERNRGPSGDDDDGREAATAGMCGKRKCKAHAGWFATLARDVRMQMQEFTRQAASLRDNELRIRLAAVQRSFIKSHSVMEVRYVGDSDNSLSSLAGTDAGEGLSSSDENDNDEEDEDEDDRRQYTRGNDDGDDDEDDVDMIDYDREYDRTSSVSDDRASSSRDRPRPRQLSASPTPYNGRSPVSPRSSGSGEGRINGHARYHSPTGSAAYVNGNGRSVRSPATDDTTSD